MDAPAVRIGIIGDFNPDFESHHAINASLQHSAGELGLPAQTTWVPTPSLEDIQAAGTLSLFDGLWAASGGPYRSMTGMLAGIQFARTRKRPFVGT